jgi:hypothetical protein
LLVYKIQNEMILSSEILKGLGLIALLIEICLVRRYERYWLPLLAEGGVDSQEQLIPLIPPLDCAWVWHVHRLNPVSISFLPVRNIRCRCFEPLYSRL